MEPKGYWSSVFYQATVLMKQRPQLGGETAFWMARNMVDDNLGTETGSGKTQSLALWNRARAGAELVLAP